MMKTITINTADLSGDALDWAVSSAIGEHDDGDHATMEIGLGRYSPSTDWSQGGPLIEEHVTALNQSDYGGWWAHSGDHVGEAITPLIALCRAIVAAKLGPSVDVPAELVEVKK